MPAYIEALINIVVSIVLIQKMGLVGVAIGTLIGMMYRGAFHVYFTSKLILSRPQKIFYKKLLLFLIPSVISFILCSNAFPITNFTILSWLIHAIIYGIICGLLFFVVCFIFFKNELMLLKSYIKK